MIQAAPPPRRPYLDAVEACARLRAAGLPLGPGRQRRLLDEPGIGLQATLGKVALEEVASTNLCRHMLKLARESVHPVDATRLRLSALLMLADAQDKRARRQLLLRVMAPGPARTASVERLDSYRRPRT